MTRGVGGLGAVLAVALLGAPAVARAGGPYQGSCAVEYYGVKSCSDYEGPYAGAPLQKTCEQFHGKWTQQRCPTKDLVGTCTKTEGRPDNLNHTRMYTPYTPASARKVCEQNIKGTFKAS